MSTLIFLLSTKGFWLAMLLALRTMVLVSCLAVFFVYLPACIQAIRERGDSSDEAERRRLTTRLKILGTPEDTSRKITVAALLGGTTLFVAMLILTNTEAVINGWGLGAINFTNSLAVRLIFYVGVLTALSVKLAPTAQSRLGRYGYLLWCSAMGVGVLSLTAARIFW